jgi:hypothetical protein
MLPLWMLQVRARSKVSHRGSLPRWGHEFIAFDRRCCAHHALDGENTQALTHLESSPRARLTTQQDSGATRQIKFESLRYHGCAGLAKSVLVQTISGETIAAVRRNGITLGEVGLNAALAGHLGAVPADRPSRDSGTVPSFTELVTKRHGSYSSERESFDGHQIFRPRS